MDELGTTAAGVLETPKQVLQLNGVNGRNVCFSCSCLEKAKLTTVSLYVLDVGWMEPTD